jgi:diacylglycerol kinase family enzyme
MTRRRVAAVVGLIAAPASIIFALVLAARDVAETLLLLILLLLAVAAASYALLRRGGARVAGLLAAGLLAAGAVAIVLDHGVLEELALVAGLWLAVASAATAFTIHLPLPPAPRPRRPVLFLNPHSGGGKAARFGLVEHARKRGIEPVALSPGDDLWQLVRDAVAAGADALAMAGGDGSQAIVAAVAAERGLPYACIPAGTRNHFALDLGVDRNDVVGALDALVDGGERVVDLAEVNGRVFVNNVSLGVYAEAVQNDRYRDAKLRTLLETLPEVLGPAGRALDLRWTGPQGRAHRSGAVIMVSNNRYRLGRVFGSGTRPRMDDGVLGVAVLETPEEVRSPVRQARPPWREWSASTFEVRSDQPVPAGIDGEAAVLTAPLRFRILPAALRVRIAPAHPGGSPSASHPDTPWEAARTLLSIAAGREPGNASPVPPQSP